MRMKNRIWKPRVDRVDASSPYWRRETVTFKAAYGNERVTAHMFLPTNAAPPYQIVAFFGGSTVLDTVRRIEDLEYPYQFIVRSGRAVVIPAFSGSLERGPTPVVLPRNQERDRGSDGPWISGARSTTWRREPTSTPGNSAFTE